MAHRQICAVLLCTLFMSLACAAPDASPRFGLSIRAGLDLDEALQELARQTGMQLVFFSQITTGRSAPELSGEYTLDAAMTRLLEGSDLTFRQVNEHTVEVRQAPPTPAPLPLAARPSKPTRTADAPLEEVLVIGKAEQLVATRVPTPLRDIPQSISVISPEQIRQQNSFELGDVLRNTPGIAVRRLNSYSETAFARGFSVTAYHVDGGSAPTQAFNGHENVYQGSPDLSEFDRVEVLRGSDALFSGNNNPGGTVSLVRKRPLAKPSVQMSTTLGSWNNYRIELDATGPLTDDGALRARADVVYGTRDYFFDRAHQDRKKIFAIVEYDLTPTSTLTAGGSYQQDDALPLNTAATLTYDGRDAHLPRSTSLTFDWAHLNTRMSQAYLQYRQEFAADWILKLSASDGQTSVDFGGGSFRSIFPSSDSQSLGTPSASFSARPDHFTLDTLEATLTGKLDWFGLKETIAIGADFARRRARQDLNIYSGFGPPLTDVAHFDPRDYPDPSTTAAAYFIADEQAALEQYGGFAWMQVDLNDAWSLSVGARVASDSYRAHAGVGVAAPGIGEFPDLIEVSEAYDNAHVVQPYGALMYRIDDHLSWYASYADIYRNQEQPYLRTDGKPVGPQHGVTLESGIKGAWRDGALNASLAIYQIEQEYVANGAQKSDVLYCCYRTSTGRSQGAELEVDGELAPAWLIGSGYSYNRIETATGNIPITSTPRHDLKIWTSAQLPGVFSRWTVGGDLRAQWKFRGAVGIKPGCKPITAECLYDIVRMRPYAVLDLRAGFELNPAWQVALSVNNALDKRYFQSDNTPFHQVWFGEPRNFMLRIDTKL